MGKNTLNRALSVIFAVAVLVSSFAAVSHAAPLQPAGERLAGVSGAVQVTNSGNNAGNADKVNNANKANNEDISEFEFSREEISEAIPAGGYITLVRFEADFQSRQNKSLFEIRAEKKGDTIQLFAYIQEPDREESIRLRCSGDDDKEICCNSFTINTEQEKIVVKIKDDLIIGDGNEEKDREWLRGLQNIESLAFYPETETAVNPAGITAEGNGSPKTEATPTAAAPSADAQKKPTEIAGTNKENRKFAIDLAPKTIVVAVVVLLLAAAVVAVIVMIIKRKKDKNKNSEEKTEVISAAGQKPAAARREETVTISFAPPTVPQAAPSVPQAAPSVPFAGNAARFAEQPFVIHAGSSRKAAVINTLESMERGSNVPVIIRYQSAEPNIAVKPGSAANMGASQDAFAAENVIEPEIQAESYSELYNTPGNTVFPAGSLGVNVTNNYDMLVNEEVAPLFEVSRETDTDFIMVQERYLYLNFKKYAGNYFCAYPSIPLLLKCFDVVNQYNRPIPADSQKIERVEPCAVTYKDNSYCVVKKGKIIIKET